MKPFGRFRPSRRFATLLALVLASALQVCDAAPLFQPLRYDEDFSFLRDPAKATEPLDRLKFIPFSSDDWLSLGGESRTRYEYFEHSLWGQGPQDNNGFWLQRFMLHADFHEDDILRVFVQLKSGLEGGRNGGPRPPDEDQFDLNQAFVDFRILSTESGTFTLRTGRQEIGLGSSRIISYREGPNVRQAFDGARAIFTAADWRADAFWVSPAKTRLGAFDDGTDSRQKLWGVYFTGPFPSVKGVHLDAYYLGYSNEAARFDQGSAREERHSLGTRVWGRTGGFDFNFEGLYQFGTFGGGSIEAWTIASDTGYTIGQLARTPRLGLKADIISGDRDPKRTDLQTFNPLFPRGSYFNDASMIGPANLFDLHPSIEVHAAKTLTCSLDCDFYWRESRYDGIYGPAVNLIRSGKAGGSRKIGDQPSLRTEWKPDHHWTAVVAVSYFFAGEFLHESGPGESTAYFTSWLTYLF